MPTFQESGKQFKFEDATASTEVPAVNTPGSAVYFGGTLTDEEQEVAAQKAIKTEAEKEADKKAIVEAMEKNINKWGDALTETIKEVMKGGAKDETQS